MLRRNFTFQDEGVEGPAATLGLAQAAVHHGDLGRLQVEQHPGPAVPDGGDGDEGEGGQGLPDWSVAQLKLIN